MSARGFIGSGDLYVARFDPALNAFGPFIGPIECSKFEITPKVEKREMRSKSRDNYNKVVAAVNLPEPFEFAVNFVEVSGDTLMQAFLGTKAAISVAGGTMTNLPVVAQLGGWVDIGHMNIQAAGFTVQNSANSTTYVRDTDYEVNLRLGTIKALPGGAITQGQDLEISGTYAAVAGTKIQGGTQPDIRAKFRLDGKNRVDDLPVIVNVWEGVVAAESAFDFLADDFNPVSVTGTLVTPTGRTSPFEVDFLSTAI